MSEDVIIRVEGLGKKYSLRHLRDQRYIALRDVLVEKATGLFRRNGGKRPQDDRTTGQPTSREEFWALKDVSFEVKEGEVIGIIGRNGAGKSTLLKILSRITEPTEGRVRIKGRVASLLEVGTGFHPELTGRENIFLNGAILGMTRAEINKKFDEIVAFAEVEKFLDTPVKRYSSGMYVRLAFAVAAHLEPEILVVDEVLAVGDADFQKKCLQKMDSVSKREGRTVFFVSHNMAAITSLTSNAIVLAGGRLAFRGKTEAAVTFYTNSVRPNAVLPVNRRGRGVHTTIRQVCLIGENSQPTQHYVPGTDLVFEVIFETDGSSSISLEFFLLSASRTKIAMASLYQFHGRTLPNSPGCYSCSVILQPMWLSSGSYSVDVTTSVINQNWDHYVEDAITFEVTASNPSGLPWDFRQDYGYGAVAMLCVDWPEFRRA
jgi:lipopolysaccharide transport system ATP-binding protein